MRKLHKTIIVIAVALILVGCCAVTAAIAAIIYSAAPEGLINNLFALLP